MHPGFPPGAPPDVRTRPRKTLTVLGLGLVVLGGLGLLTACGTSGSTTAGAPLSAAPGQTLPGMPGDSATGAVPASSASGAASMPGMTMPSAGRSAGNSTPVSGDAVAIKGFAFAPAALSVKVGTTVTWTNQDTEPHTVTSTGSGGPLTSPAMQTGDTFHYTFTKPGTYHYLCTIHPFMTATVTVTR